MLKGSRALKTQGFYWFLVVKTSNYIISILYIYIYIFLFFVLNWWPILQWQWVQVQDTAAKVWHTSDTVGTKPSKLRYRDGTKFDRRPDEWQWLDALRTIDWNQGVREICSKNLRQPEHAVDDFTYLASTDRWSYAIYKAGTGGAHHFLQPKSWRSMDWWEIWQKTIMFTTK